LGLDLDLASAGDVRESFFWGGDSFLVAAAPPILARVCCFLQAVVAGQGRFAAWCRRHDSEQLAAWEMKVCSFWFPLIVFIFSIKLIGLYFVVGCVDCSLFVMDVVGGSARLSGRKRCHMVRECYLLFSQACFSPDDLFSCANVFICQRVGVVVQIVVVLLS
jgi:hypothetical protein